MPAADARNAPRRYALCMLAGEDFCSRRGSIMAEHTFHADGDRWVVGIDDQATHPGMRALVFHCISNTQRPYRVLEIPVGGADPDLSERSLARYFEAAHTLDYTTDDSSEPHRHGSMG
jgi:hypothetical protein